MVSGDQLLPLLGPEITTQDQMTEFQILILSGGVEMPGSEEDMNHPLFTFIQVAWWNST
jgi:hypothetical protein